MSMNGMVNTYLGQREERIGFYIKHTLCTQPEHIHNWDDHNLCLLQFQFPINIITLIMITALRHHLYLCVNSLSK